MKTIIIKSRNDEDAEIILKFARKMKMKARYLTQEELDDAYLVHLIDEGMEEEGEVPLEDVRNDSVNESGC